MAKVIGKHIYFHQTHIDVLDEIISTHAEVKNYNETVRFLCMNYSPEMEKKVNSNRAKLNGMSKEIFILAKMVSGFANLHLRDTGVLVSTNPTIYQGARERVERKIRSNRAKKYSPQLRKPMNESVYIRVDPFDLMKTLKK